MKELGQIQQALVAPKDQFNKHGNYNYRSCEDILAALKPLLAEVDGTILLQDQIVLIGERYYVEAEAVLWIGENTVSAKGYAREVENRKGMDQAQITGAASSYARKYALNGLFMIDDGQDADSMPRVDEVPDQAITAAQAKELEDKVIQTGSDQDAFLVYAKASKFREIQVSMLNQCRMMLAQKAKGQK